MRKLKAWFIAGRFFALPSIVVPLSFFAAALAGFNFTKWLVSLLIAGSAWLATNFLNDWRDYVLGADKTSGGSIAKPYTAGSQVLPRGWLSIRTIQLTVLALLSISFTAFITLAPLRLDTVTLYSLGVALGLSYTDYWKPRRGYELCLCLALFVLIGFCYTVIRPFNPGILAAAGLIGGMIGILLQLVDRYPDIQESEYVKSLADLLFKAKLKFSGVFWFLITGIFTMQTGFVLLGWLPNSTLISLFSLPVAHISGIFLDYDFEKGSLLLLLWIGLYFTFAGLGVLFC